MHPDNEGAYSASTLRCHACAEQARAAAKWGRQGDSDGIYFSVARD